MPKRDPETGKFVSDRIKGLADYTDFEYEHHAVEALFADPSSAGGAELTFSIDPLEDRGGLESDEVAEIVGIQYSVMMSTVQVQDAANISQNNNVYRSAVGFGANISIDSEFPRAVATADETGEFTQNDPGFDDSGADSVLDLVAATEPGLFWHESMVAHPVETDSAGNHAVSGANAVQNGARNYRGEMATRGPVIDPTDELSFLIFINAAGDQDFEPTVEVTQTVVYDIATLEGARRQFSVP